MRANSITTRLRRYRYRCGLLLCSDGHLTAFVFFCVSSFFLKLTTLSVFRTISGRLFHAVSDAQVNECEANTDVIPLGLDSNLCPSERRRRVGTYSLMRLRRYSG